MNNCYRSECGCTSERPLSQNASLAMVSVPAHSFEKLFDNDTALARGTLFCELYLPFAPCQANVRRGGACTRCLK